MNDTQTFLISAGAMTLLSFVIWNRNKKKFEEKRLCDKVLSSPAVSWKKVGKVKNIFFYPLKSGKGKSLEQCKLDKYGIKMKEPGMFTMKDRMFMVYEEQTGKFQTGRKYAKLLLVNVSAVDKDRAQLEVADMPTLVFDIPKKTDDTYANQTNLFMWFDEPVKCLDCGPETAAWLSKYLTGSDSGLRLGLFIPNKDRSILTGAWEEHARMYKAMRSEDLGLFSDLASYMLMSESSVEDLNGRLNKPIKPLQLRPNILIEGCEPYAEDKWEWIRIGEKAIVRNFKPCPRCTMTRVDPDTGIPDPHYEPLKTLRSYRKIEDPEKNKLEEYAPIIGVYCGLYRSGNVKLNDDVFVYQPNP